MKQVAVAHSRAPQILALLNEYGPLSVRGLQVILRPRITKRRLQECLLRLYQKGLVIGRFEATPFSRQYYELSQADAVRENIHLLTGIPHDRLIQPYFRSQELLHNEECAFWAYYLKEAFPDADVVRDFRISEYKDISSKLMMDEKNPEIRPDIVLFYPENFEHESLLIPIEIELSRKSDTRLFRKLRKYANGTHSDGVIYLCHKNTLADTIGGIYKKSVMEKALRIAHYKDLFLLLGDRSFHADNLEPKLVNVNAETVSLKDWVQALRATPHTKRRKLKLTKPA